jgi:hypothetical protein
MTHVYDGGPWRGISTEEQVERIARGSTPVREYVDGKFQPWIDPASRMAAHDLAGSGELSSRDGGLPSETPVAPLPASPSRSVSPVGSG